VENGVQAATFDGRRLVMFLSADVVGSTAFKSSAVGVGGQALWLEAFETLFRELPLIFIGKLAEYFFDEDDVPQGGVWKVMGDEVVFAVLPQNLRHAHRVAAAFCDAVASYDARIAGRWPLRIRGCCWGAEIGQRNRAIEIPEMLGGSENRPYLDFLGPDIDIGFRLSGHSRPGELILSPNLAEAFAALEDQRGLRYHFVGEAPLKGVCGGQPFPLVLVSLEGIGAPTAEATAVAELAERLARTRASMLEHPGIEPAPPIFSND
jgi:class 3 adenylate cyclase